MKKSRNYEYDDMDERKQRKNQRKMIQKKDRHNNRKNLNEIIDSMKYNNDFLLDELEDDYEE